MKNQHFLIPLKDLEKENKQQLITQDEIKKNKKRIEEKRKKIRNLCLNLEEDKITENENENNTKESLLKQSLKQRQFSPIITGNKNNTFRLMTNYSINKKKNYKSIFDNTNENLKTPIKLKNKILNENLDSLHYKTRNNSNYLNFKSTNINNENNSKSSRINDNNLYSKNEINNNYYTITLTPNSLKNKKLNKKNDDDSNYFFSFKKKNISKPKTMSYDFDYKNGKNNYFKNIQNNIFNTNDYNKINLIGENNKQQNENNIELFYGFIMPVNPMNDVLSSKVNYLYGNEDI